MTMHIFISLIATILSLLPAETTAVTVDTTALIKEYCLQAEKALDAGKDLEAVDCYNKCIELSSYIEPMFLLSSSLFNIASIYHQNGENDKALEYITKSITVDSKRGSDSILALRYLLAAEILYDKGEYAKAIEMADAGRPYARMRSNHNVEARLMLMQVKCGEALAGSGPDWAELEKGYREALDTLSYRNPRRNYISDPYRPEFLYRLGLVVAAQGRDADSCFLGAIEASKKSSRLYGRNPLIEMECCRKLAEKHLEDGDEAGAAQFLEDAQRLSYAPYVQKLSTKMSLSQLEFIRQEKEMEIRQQKVKSHILLLVLSIFSAALVCLGLMYRQQVKQKRTIEAKNAQLLKAVVGDNVPMPEIKLSKREKDVLAMCCQGMISKEIAGSLNLSVRTVESHKANLFRKFGVNTTNELISIAFKSGLVK